MGVGPSCGKEVIFIPEESLLSFLNDKQWKSYLSDANQLLGNDPRLAELSAQAFEVINDIYPIMPLDFIRLRLAALCANLDIGKDVEKLIKEHTGLIGAVNNYMSDNYLDDSPAYWETEIHTHDLFFHGTSLNNYQKMLDTGLLHKTDYSNRIKHQNTDRINSFFEADSGNTFFTDLVDTALLYAFRDSRQGVILCFDLYGCKAHMLYNRCGRQFAIDDCISTDRITEVYFVDCDGSEVTLTNEYGENVI